MRKVQMLGTQLMSELTTMGLHGTALFCELMAIGDTRKVDHPTMAGHGLDITKLYGDVYSVVMH